MAIKIYKMDFSPPCRAVMMLCDLMGLEMELIEVKMQEFEHLKPEYLEKNPMHCVPIVEDGDVRILDSNAAMMYLVDKYGKDDSLYPKDLVRRAAVNQGEESQQVNSSVLFARCKRITAPMFLKKRYVLPQEVVDDVNEAFSFLEEFLTRSKYIAGSTLTIADISNFAMMSSAFKITPLDKYPKIKAWVAGIEKESYAKKYNAPGVAALASFTQNLKIEGA